MCLEDLGATNEKKHAICLSEADLISLISLCPLASIFLKMTGIFFLMFGKQNDKQNQVLVSVIYHALLTPLAPMALPVVSFFNA